jgi:uncharacterized OsmC-like protein
MHMEILHSGRWQFSVRCRGHQIVSDQPVEEDGEDVGMTPVELCMMKEVDPDLGQGILRMVKHCTVHNTLMTPPKIDLSLSNT